MATRAGALDKDRENSSYGADDGGILTMVMDRGNNRETCVQSSIFVVEMEFFVSSPE